MLFSFVYKKTMGFFMWCKNSLLFIDGPQKDKENFFIAKAICCKKVFLFLCVQYYSGSEYEKAKYHKIPNECFRSISYQ